MGASGYAPKRGTETYSGRVAASLVVTDILGDKVTGCRRSLRDASKIDEEAVWAVAEKIAAEVDSLLAFASSTEQVKDVGADSFACSCGTSASEITLQINGKTVAVKGLPLIFEHVHKQGLGPVNDFADRVLDTVRIYHSIEPGEENNYRDALAEAYRQYCQH